MSDDTEAQGFAEPVAGSVEAALARLDALAAAAAHAETQALLASTRERVSGLDPARLQPNRGLAGLFDSRNKRLKAFRGTYGEAADAAASTSADLADRSGAIARRHDELEALWTELNAGVTQLDTHIAAGRARRDLQPLIPAEAPPASPVPPEAAAAFEDTPDIAAEDGDAPTTGVQPETVEGPEAGEDEVPPVAELPQLEPVPDAAASEPAEPDPQLSPDAGAPTEEPATDAPTDPLGERLDMLVALRTRALAALPRIRALQNAEHAAPSALTTAREAVEAWSADWRDALGLAGKRPRKVRPETARLIESRDALVGHLSTAERTLAAAQSRLTEVTARAATRRPAPSEAA